MVGIVGQGFSVRRPEPPPGLADDRRRAILSRSIVLPPTRFCDCDTGLLGYMRKWMYKRFCSLVLVLAMVATGYQPTFGMTNSAAPDVQMAADADCPEMQKDDCCDHTEKGKRLCVWNDACASRCHINAGLEVGCYVPAVCDCVAVQPPSRERLALKAAGVGPLFRPPIF